MKKTIGIIGLPSFFGISYSYNSHMRTLRNFGYQTETINPYEGQAVKRPFFPRYMFADQEKFNAVVARLDDDIVLKSIHEKVKILRKKGCNKIFIMGFGLGGIFGLKYAERKNNSLSGIVAWYPHLIYPKTIKKPEPDFNKITIPVLMFFGGKDNRLEAGTIKLAKDLANKKKIITTVVYPKGGHAFADRFVQNLFLSPLFVKEAANETWKKAQSWIISISS